MSVVLRRNKMVSFRLSPEEYRRIRVLCAAQGLRSVSDFARRATQKLMAEENDSDPLSYEVRDLRTEVQSISAELDRIAEQVEARRAER